MGVAWFTATDAATGRLYYYNVEGDVSWTKPASLLDKPETPLTSRGSSTAAAAAAAAAADDWLTIAVRTVTVFFYGKPTQQEGVELLDASEKGGSSSATPPDHRSFWVQHAEQIKELYPFLWPESEPLLRGAVQQQQQQRHCAKED
jgi:hypothetical protein